MSATTTSTGDRALPFGRVVPPTLWGRSWRLVERNVFAYRKMWLVFVAGFLEPILYLFSIGFGVGTLVGDLPGPGSEPIPYEVFVAPGLLASAAMNGAVFDATFNFFIKYKYLRTYDAVLASPLSPIDVATGEVLWALLRGAMYSAAFLGTMAALGQTQSWWALGALPATVLIGAAFASAGLAATTWMRSHIDFDYVNLAIIPLFLFSATFFPLDRYPEAVQWIVRITPLYQGVDLCRSLTTGDVGFDLLFNVAYLLVIAVAGVTIASRRLQRLLQP